jgi:hypothetical protein
MVIRPNKVKTIAGEGEIIEGLPEWIEKNRYANRFLHISNHSSMRDIPLRTRELRINCTGDIPVKLIGEIMIEVKRLRSYYGSCSFDQAGGFSRSEYIRDSAYKITGKFIDGSTKFLGFWFKSKRSFVLCDLTHTQKSVKLLNLIMRKCRMKVLGNLPPDVTVEKVMVTLGADPEFELFDARTNRFLHAANEGFDSTESEIGCDGCSDTMELRQPPAETPEQAVENLRELFQEMATSRYNLLARGDNLPVGCHVHVGIGRRENSPEDLILVLDHLVGKPTIEMSGEARGAYERLSMWRTQPHGFEYRTPPSAITARPELYGLVMKIVKNSSEKYYSLTKRTEMSNDLNVALKDWGGLTEEEVMKYHTLLDEVAENLHKDVIAAWVDRPASVLKLALSFSDEWDAPMKAMLMATLNDVKVTQDYTLHLFGLMQSRGYVFSGIPMDSTFPDFPDSAENLKAVVIAYNNGVGVGVPYCFRRAGHFATTEQQRVDLVNAFHDAIIKRLKEEGVICV